MKIAVICKSDGTGGAAIVSRRLTEALIAKGVEAKMVVMEKTTDLPFVVKTGFPLMERLAFLAERLKIFLFSGVSRKNLFKIDTGEFGLPLWRHPAVKEADAVILNWVNQGMLSLNGIRRIAATGKQVIWTMHDMWNLTGICHHAFECRHYRQRCGDCFLLGDRKGPRDLSFKVHEKKSKIYDGSGIKFVAVSNWLYGLARKSTLLKDREVSVIPNPISVSRNIEKVRQGDTFRIIFSAARIDDPIKGLDILRGGLRKFKESFPEKAEKIEIVFAGAVKNPKEREGFAVKTVWLGSVSGDETMRDIYSGGDAVISTSYFENLPGTLIEGMLCGCVPVAFDRGGQRDIIDHLETGYLMDWQEDSEGRSKALCEALLWAMEQPEEKRIAMRKSVEERFSYHAVAKKYLELLKPL